MDEIAGSTLGLGQTSVSTGPVFPKFFFLHSCYTQITDSSHFRKVQNYVNVSEVNILYYNMLICC